LTLKNRKNSFWGWVVDLWRGWVHLYSQD